MSPARLGVLEAVVVAAIMTLVGSVVSAPAALAQTAQCLGTPATIVGTAGSDTLTGTGVGDVIVGLAGDDQIDAGGGDDLVCGEDGDDIISGGEGSDIVLGEDGNDALKGGPGGDTAVYATALGSVSVDLSAGTAGGFHGEDTLTEIDSVVGSDFDDVLRGDAEDNALTGLGGNDIIDGGPGDSDSALYLFSGGVFATLTGGTALAGGEGFDALRNIEILIGSEFDDVLIGNEEQNVLDGNGGDDQLWGRAGPDVLTGGTGNDGLFGGEGISDMATYIGASQPVDADLATDSAKVGADVDALLGVEVLVGSRFNDTLRGDAQENVFFGGGGDDLIDGREAEDTAAFWASTRPDGTGTFETGPVHADLTEGKAWNFSDEGQTAGDTLARIERLWGSPASDLLVGDLHNNDFLGDAGDDRLFGRRGNDYFDGGPGNDRMFGGPGDRDIVEYLFGPKVRANLGRGRVNVGDDRDRVGGIEFLSGSPDGDVLRGSRRPDFLIGNAGRDRLWGRGGDDTLNGNEGKDRLDGGPGRDHCLDKPRVNCEAGSLPKHLLDLLQQFREKQDRNIRLRRGLRLRF